MNSLKVSLENCYGIGEFNHEFSFAKSNANLIYASNGTMKTSLAKTFSRISKNEAPEEKLLGLDSKYDIKIDGVAIQADQIFVVHPFDGEYESKNISTLLVNATEKEKYDAAFRVILDAKLLAINKLNKLSRIKKEDIETRISQDIQADNFIDALKKLKVSPVEDARLAEIKYAEIFDEKVIALLGSEGVMSGIEEYVLKYNELIEKSPLYSVGKFNPANAESISKILRKEKFFEANHRLLLNSTDIALSNANAFDELLERSRTEILGDKELSAIHTKILNGVASVKTFQTILEKFPEIAQFLCNLEDLKGRIWAAYYQKAKEDFDVLMDLFDSKKNELAEIEQMAQLEGTMWHEAKEIFKKRFHVPFDIDVDNSVNVILGSSAPNMIFTFKGPDGKDIRFNRGQLASLDILSIGERRAMYLMNVIFEFKARIAKGKPTLVIVDDIADSFDYKNKFAIMEYLRELSRESALRIIVLTHNFDFYRTFQGRILDTAKWDNSYLAKRIQGKISLTKGFSKQVSTPFEHWRKNYATNASMFVAMIPFVRNLTEYKEGTGTELYMLLTSMLHIKTGTKEITINCLIRAIEEVIGIPKTACVFDHASGLVDFVYSTADNLCLTANDDEISLETKIALSIATRLKAEEFMWAKIKDKSAITNSQTAKLYDRFCKENTLSEFKDEIKILDQVLLMTPENIHLNSFMYEPLLDMSCLHLARLYSDVKQLNDTTGH